MITCVWCISFLISPKLNPVNWIVNFLYRPRYLKCKPGDLLQGNPFSAKYLIMQKNKDEVIMLCFYNGYNYYKPELVRFPSKYITKNIYIKL